MKTLEYPYPSKERGLYLSQRLKEKLIQSLTHLIEINRDRIDFIYVEIHILIERISVAKKLSCYYFALNSIFLEATNQNKMQILTPLVKELTEFQLTFNMDFHPELCLFDFNDEEKNKNKADILKKYILFDLPPHANLFSPSHQEYHRCQYLVEKALSLIKNVYPELYAELLTFVGEFMVFRSDDLKAGCSFNLYGLIYLSSNNSKSSIINMAETIVHEAAHHYLYNICTEDPLVLNDYEEQYFSPIKDRERPMIGLYHAAFVLARVIDFLQRLQLYKNKHGKFHINEPNANDDSEDNEDENLEIERLLVKYRAIARESYRTVKSSARLTDLGNKIIQGVCPIIEEPTTVA